MPSGTNLLGPVRATHPALGAGGDIEMMNRVMSVNGIFIDNLDKPVLAANNLALTTKGDSWHITHVTGVAQVNLISSTGWRGGSRITLIFDTSLTIKNNQSASGDFKPILLNSGADFSAVANSTLSLIYDSTNKQWLEVGRKA